MNCYGLRFRGENKLDIKTMVERSIAYSLFQTYKRQPGREAPTIAYVAQETVVPSIK
jgi:hypothetical protein